MLLASCTLPGTQTESTSSDASTSDNTVQYSGTGVSMFVPKTWTLATSADVPTPRHGAVMVAYISPEVKYGFSNNFIIMKDTLTNIVTSAKYSELNSLQTSKNYLEYTKTRDEAFTFGDDETSRVYVFEAKYNQTTPKMKFVQTARVCGTSVYLLHFSLSLDKSPENYIDLLKTFRCQ